MAGMLSALARGESGGTANKVAKAGHAENVLEASARVPDFLPVKKAIATVWDKSGLAELAKELSRFGVNFIATEGTASYLRGAAPDLKVTDLSAYTRYPENLNGRLKTLHPKVQAGVLAIKGYHDETLKRAGVEAEYIDLVIVNLYPFEKTVSGGAEYFECIENIDIGGPALLRAAAKNHVCVNAVCDPNDYEELLKEMRQYDGKTSRAFRRRCAEKVFTATANYDQAIAEWFRRQHIQE